MPIYMSSRLTLLQTCYVKCKVVNGFFWYKRLAEINLKNTPVTCKSCFKVPYHNSANTLLIIWKYKIINARACVEVMSINCDAFTLKGFLKEQIQERHSSRTNILSTVDNLLSHLFQFD